MSELTELGGAALAEGYRSGKLDPVSVTDAHLRRIEERDGQLRAYITVAAETARAEALASLRRWREGRPIGPLDGLPIAVKDNIEVAGLPCTAGTEALATYKSLRSARVVQRLAAAGAILLGKLNMHEAALGATTDNIVHGRCQNPRRFGHTPGGSSGGSGAAVAAGLCVAALGTDTMGSVRVPASYCGVFGFKPSAGAIDPGGVIPLSVTLDMVGPLARTVPDLQAVAAALLEAPLFLQRGSAAEAVGLRGLKIGRVREVGEIVLEAPVATAYEALSEALAQAGAEVVEVSLPHWSPGAARRAGLLVSEAEGYEYYRERLGADLRGLSPNLQMMLRYPTRVGSERLAAAYSCIETVRTDVRRALRQVDLLLMPSTPQTSFPHGDTPPESQADCTALANFAGAPAVSFPTTLEPLPVGMQLVGPPGGDHRLLALLPAIVAVTGFAEVPVS